MLVMIGWHCPLGRGRAAYGVQEEQTQKRATPRIPCRFAPPSWVVAEQASRLPLKMKCVPLQRNVGAGGLPVEYQQAISFEPCVPRCEVAMPDAAGDLRVVQNVSRTGQDRAAEIVPA